MGELEEITLEEALETCRRILEQHERYITEKIEDNVACRESRENQGVE